jgi:glutathione S-transferase
MIKLHYLNQSRAQRILWLLEELGVPYELKRYQRDPQTMLAPPALKQVHPLGKSPVVEDDGVVVAESGAIIEYLTGKYDRQGLVPATGTPERRRYTFWLHYAEGSLMPPLLLKLVFERIASGPSPWIVRPLLRAISKRVQQSFIDPQLQLHLGYVEQELAQHRWFAGEHFTAADIQMSFPLAMAKTYKALDDRYPHVLDFLKRIHERPAYQRALEKSGGDEI